MRLLRWLLDYWPNLAQIFLATLLAVLTILRGEEAWTHLPKLLAEFKAWGQLVAFWSIVVILLIMAGIQVYQLRRTDRLSKLKTELNDSKVEIAERNNLLRNAVDHFLYDFATHSFPAQGGRAGPQDRISIYRLDSSGHFVPFGRVATNPEYDELARRQYPSDQGVIGKAWREEEAHEPALPDSATNLEQYIATCEEKYQLPAETTRALRMKSRSLYARQIRSTDERRPLAVIVIESTEANRFSRELLEKSFNSRRGKALSKLVQLLSESMPKSTISSIIEIEGGKR